MGALQERKTGYSFRKVFEPGKRHTCDEVKTVEDWCEWQANVLAAVLLMPKFALHPHLQGGWDRLHMFTMYGERFDDVDYNRIKGLAQKFDVSFTAMKIRLDELGYIKHKPQAEYRVSTIDVVVDDLR